MPEFKTPDHYTIFAFVVIGLVWTWILIHTIREYYASQKSKVRQRQSFNFDGNDYEP